MAPVASAWHRFFDRLKPGAQVLDLCTGNGAVALLAAKSGGSRCLKITAIDQAAIDPGRYVPAWAELAGEIEFRAGVAVEDLPFADRSFDVVTCQYGIEYSDLDRSAAEVARVLRRDGSLRLVLHASEGVPVAESKVAIREVDHLLVDLDLPGSAAAAYAAICAVERTVRPSEAALAAADSAFASFSAALDGAAEFAKPASDGDMVRNTAFVLFDAFEKRRHCKPDLLTAKAKDVRDCLLAHRGRSEAMVNAALSRDEAEALGARIGDLTRLAVTCSQLSTKASLVAHAIEARPHAASAFRDNDLASVFGQSGCDSGSKF